MPANQPMPTTAAMAQEVSELRSRVEWLDEERRKSNRRLIELTQSLDRQEREVQKRDTRIKELEDQLAKTASQLSRVALIDTQLAQFRDEFVQMVEGYDQRRIHSSEELERLHRVQQEIVARELAEIRKELPPIPRLHDEMDLRRAEEARLANLIGVSLNRLTVLEGQVESWSNDLSYVAEAGKSYQRTLNELQTALLEINKRWEPINSRIDTIAASESRLESKVQSLGDVQLDVRHSLKQWAEQMEVGEYQRNQRVEEWRRILEEQEARLKQFASEWVGYAEQHKASRMALQELGELRRQLEQKVREAEELVRVEMNRMHGRWNNFTQENDQKLKNFEIDAEQRAAVAQRHLKQLSDQLLEVRELITKVQQDQEKLWRVQTAQGDAVKLIPRVWLEEVEKALAQNPNRRRQPTLREEIGSGE